MIYLIGMKHCGKTTIGRSIAGSLSVPFIDIDDIILRIVARDTNKGVFDSCGRVYKTFGRDYFRGIEAQAAGEILSENPQRNAVCALGGGSIENREAYKRLKVTGLFVYLEESRDILFTRISEKELPAYLDSEHPYEDFLRVCEKREQEYTTAADLIIQGRGRPAEEIAEETIQRIREVKDGV